jgi:hypothetical protein
MASIGEAKARLDKAKAATAGKTRPTRNTRGGGTTTSAEFIELDAAQRAFGGMGGQAAFDKANAPAQPSNLTFGGAGAGMSIDRAAKEDRKRKAESKLDTYDRSQLNFIGLRLEAEKQSLDQRLQAGLLSETAHKIAVAELELESSKEEVAEKLRLSRLAINRDNLSAADKLLKLKDTEIIAEREISIATNKRNIAIEGATKELAGPFNDAMNAARLQMEEQQMLLGNLQDGIEGLTPDQRAYLTAVEMTKDLSEDEIEILKEKINLLRSVTEQQIALNQEVEQGKILNALGGQLRLAKILDPKAELRESLRQQNPLFSEDKIEQQAALSEQVAAAQKTKEQLQGIASSIGNSFGEAFKGIITGSMTAQQALAGMFQSIADSFADMAGQMIAEFMRMQALGLLETIFGAVAGGLGGGGANLGPNSAAVFGTNSADMMKYAPLPIGYANGGIAPGGFTAFANGGMVTGPTMGLVGEGRYNEAIIPLPDGKSVPVQLAGGAGGNAAPINTSIVVNVKNGQADSQMSGNQGNQLARELEGAVRQVILKESRPGGLISSSR